MGIIYVSSKTNTSLEDVGGFVARDVIIVTIVGADWRTMRKLYFWHLIQQNILSRTFVLCVYDVSS